jgi:hypothetical protein
MRQTYAGGCHCGAVRFTVELDLAQGTARCNCSICAKARFWAAFVPEGALRLAAGADDLSEYRFGRESVRHRFCRHCGIKPFGTGRNDALGAFHAINVACPDGIADADLAGAPLAFFDGRHDRWDRPPAETRHL